jgi:Spy/CpxP family protein refolding chaperone
MRVLAAAAAALTLVTVAAMATVAAIATVMLSPAVHDAGRRERDGGRRAEQECRLFVRYRAKQ